MIRWITSKFRSQVTTARSPAAWFLDALLGRSESSSGVRVSEATALSLSAYYCGVNMISSTIAALPLNVMKRGQGRMREVQHKHPVQRILHDEPNPEMTAVSLRQTWVMHVLARGNCYGEIVRDSSGNVKHIWPIPPHMVTPRRDVDGVLWYEVRFDDGEARYLSRENIIHVPGLSYDGIVGYGLIQVARETIGLNTAQDQYAGKFFRNGGNVSMTLETDKILKDESFKRLQKEVVSKFSGLENAHRIAILENGLKAKPLNPTHEEAQLIEARQFSIQEWARFLNMPPHKLKDLSKASFSNIEEQNIEWISDTINPWVNRFEQEFNRKLFRDRNAYYTKHVLEGQLRGNIQSRFQAYAVARNWGWMSANDVLELEDRNPISGDIGDIYLIPGNMVVADKAMEPTPQATEVVRACAKRVVRYEEKAKPDAGDLKSRLSEWLSMDSDQADKYCKIAPHLKALAHDNGISTEELSAVKVATLELLARGDL